VGLLLLSQILLVARLLALQVSLGVFPDMT
jgi:hypothetical protein